MSKQSRYGDSSTIYPPTNEYGKNVDTVISWNTAIYTNGKRDSIAPGRFRIEKVANPEHGKPNETITPLQLQGND